MDNKIIKTGWEPDYDFIVSKPHGYYHLAGSMYGVGLVMDFIWKNDALVLFDGYCLGAERYTLTEDILKECHPKFYEALRAAFQYENQLRPEQLGNYIGVYLACKEYGFQMECKFGIFYIKPHYEKWRFAPPGMGKTTLYHCPLRPYRKRKLERKRNYHIQFQEKIPMQGIIKYIYEHEQAKYTDETIDFSF